MSPGARVDSDSPRRLSAAVGRLVGESERSAAAALSAVRGEMEGAQRQLGTRRRQLEAAKRRLVEAESTLARCLATPRANCGALERAVQAARAEVHRQESRVRVAEGVLTEMRRLFDRLSAAQRRLVSRQRQSAEGAERELARATASLERYLVGAPAGDERGGSGGGAAGASSPASPASGQPCSPPQFSSDHVAASWAQGFATAAGRAYFTAAEASIRELAASLKPFGGEYTVDAHGSPEAVSVGDTKLDAAELAELVRSDPDWKNRPVRLFSCNTGKGERPIAADLAAELNVKVTAPKDLVWSNSKGESWVGSREMKMVGGTLQWVPGAPQADGWSAFEPGHHGNGGSE